MIVTADHAHTSQIVDGNTPGLTAKLDHQGGLGDGRGLRHLGCGGSQQHTGTQVRVPATDLVRRTWWA